MSTFDYLKLQVLANCLPYFYIIALICMDMKDTLSRASYISNWSSHRWSNDSWWKKVEQILKRIFDIFLSSIGLIISIPVLITFVLISSIITIFGRGNVYIYVDEIKSREELSNELDLKENNLQKESFISSTEGHERRIDYFEKIIGNITLKKSSNFLSKIFRDIKFIEPRTVNIEKSNFTG